MAAQQPVEPRPGYVVGTGAQAAPCVHGVPLRDPCEACVAAVRAVAPGWVVPRRPDWRSPWVNVV